MANLSRTTRDHEQIRRWAEERGGKPAHVVGTGSGEDVGILRIDFPGYSGEGSLEPISWDQWFEKFDERNLALIYQEETVGGERSNFNKIVDADTAAEAEEKSHERASRTSRSGAKAAAGKKAAGKKAGAAKKAAASKKTTSSAARRSAGPSRKAAKGASKAITRKAASKGMKKNAAKGGKKTAAKKGAGRKAAKKRR